MGMRDARFFTHPTRDWQRRYEALRACFVRFLAGFVDERVKRYLDCGPNSCLIEFVPNSCLVHNCTIVRKTHTTVRQQGRREARRGEILRKAG